MSKRILKAGNFVYPLPCVMVSLGDIDDETTHNIITIGWVGTINTNPPMTYISVRKERASYDILTKYNEFVINLTTRDLAFATDFCGVRSGRDYDKFKHCNLTPIKSDLVKAPSIKESPVNIECKVCETRDLGSHTMFIADVVNIKVSDEYFDENDKFCLEDANPICYFHGAYYNVGEKIGTFGYSVMKEKTKQKRLKEQNEKQDKKSSQGKNKEGTKNKPKQKSKTSDNKTKNKKQKTKVKPSKKAKQKEKQKAKQNSNTKN